MPTIFGIIASENAKKEENQRASASVGGADSIF
jgi:hypothetical protein